MAVRRNLLSFVAWLGLLAVAAALLYMQTVSGPWSSEPWSGESIIQNGFPVPFGVRQAPRRDADPYHFVLITDVWYSYSKTFAVLVDAFVSLIVVFSTAFALAKHLTGANGRLQFTLRSLFAWMAVAGGLCGLIAIAPAEPMPWYVWVPFSFGIACTIYAAACGIVAVIKRSAKLIRSRT